MTDRKILKTQSLAALFDALRASGRRILAPRAKGDKIHIEEVASPGEMAQDYIQTSISAKDVVFPRFEELMSYKTEGKEVTISEPAEKPVPTVIFGIRPCDAASFGVLNSVFTWDSQDKFFVERLAATAVIGVSCTKSDQYCFCTSLGGSPGDTRGSDILLTPLSADEYLAEIVTDKGREIAALAPGLFTAAADQAKEPHLAQVPVQFDMAKLEAKLPALFDKEEVWINQSLRCLGCGACAFVCPTCVCFDIQDEPVKNDCGKRLRCWDSCGFSLFTLHTSGHNPRSRQSARWRQRVMHKFSYFKDRLGFIGCVGCGRCSRSCPADMNLLEHLKRLAEVEL